MKFSIDNKLDPFQIAFIGVLLLATIWLNKYDLEMSACASE